MFINLSLSLSHTHTHTHTHMKSRTHNKCTGEYKPVDALVSCGCRACDSVERGLKQQLLHSTVRASKYSKTHVYIITASYSVFLIFASLPAYCSITPVKGLNL